jgi:hypothetical protein
MRGARRFAVLAAVVAVFMLAGLVAPAAASADGSITVRLSDLSSPKGLSVGFRSTDLILSQGAFSAPAPILQYVLRGDARGETEELSGPENVTDIAVGDDGAVWAIGGDRNLYRVPPGGGSGPELIANIPAYQATDPDPFDSGPDADPEGSNPYGLAVLPSGDALVADAQNNDVLRVTAAGDITTVARFDTEVVSTDHVGPPPPGEEPLPPTIPAEAVPTSIALGPNGWVFIGELKGFPFRPGTSHVWALNPDAEGAVCSVNTPDADCKVAYEGFTSINDIAYDLRTGTLYVYELAEGGTLEFEHGFETGDFPPAVLLEVKKNKITELAAGKLSQPGGIIVGNRGHVYVTDGMFACSGSEGEPPCHGRLVEVHR